MTLDDMRFQREGECVHCVSLGAHCPECAEETRRIEAARPRPMRVYLAGPINGTTDTQAHAWRQTVKSALAKHDVTFLDPMARDYRGKETENVEAIVEGDKRDILSCDLVFAYCWQPSWGTAMEIHYACRENIRVWAIVEGKTPSPWLAYHARIFTTLGDAVVALARLTPRIAPLTDSDKSHIRVPLEGTHE